MRLLGLAVIFLFAGCARSDSEADILKVKFSRVKFSESERDGYTEKAYYIIAKQRLEDLELTEEDVVVAMNELFGTVTDLLVEAVVDMFVLEEKQGQPEKKQESAFAKDPGKANAIKQLLRDGVRFQVVHVKSGRSEIVHDEVLTFPPSEQEQ